MNKKANIHNTPQEETLNISVQGLKGRQSVRATFKLPEHIIKLLGLVARQLGLKQKSLFDQLVENTDVLNEVAATAQSTNLDQEERRQKTFVLSKKSLEVLDTVSGLQNIPRDVLVEISIRRLLPIMTAEQEKHRKRIQILQEMETCRDYCRKLSKKAKSLLGSDDQTTILVNRTTDFYEKNVQELHILIDNGRALENYKQS